MNRKRPAFKAKSRKDTGIEDAAAISAVVRELLDDAIDGIPHAQKIIAESLQASQQAILQLTAKHDMEYRDPFTGRREKISLETMGGSDAPKTTTVFLAVTAMSWLAGGAVNFAASDLLDLIYYWTDHDDCLFLPTWPFSKDEVKKQWKTREAL